jgi:ornithine cyclodeaminase/alanine dehydrogenase-like protein (mu-crystallin family)
MDGALQAVEHAIIAHHHGRLRQGRLVDREPGEFEGIRLSLLAGEGVLSGMRVFGNPPHTRMFLLFDGITRALVALMDYGVLNSLRVGATAGVAARHLAPSSSKRIGLLGSGWQAQPQVVALARAVPTIQHISVFSPTPAHRETFAEQMSDTLGIVVQPVASAAEAIQDADVVDLCAPGHFDVRQPLFDAAWIKPGALVISMASDQYPPEFGQAARIVADIPDPASEAATSLGAIIVEGARARRAPHDSVIYRLEGGTVQDLFVATWGYEWARARGRGRPFDLSA